MILLSPDNVPEAHLQAFCDFLWTLADGELREALAYLHDALVAGNSVAVGAIEDGAA